MSEIHIAWAADRAYLAHGAAMFRSAVTCSTCTVVGHFLHGPGIPDQELGRLRSMGESGSGGIELHEIREAELVDLPTENRFGPAMWYRIFLADLLPGLERVLYVDVDTLATSDLSPLGSCGLGDCLLAAVGNVFMERHRYRWVELELESWEYFNSGVLLMNLDAMRRERFASRVIELVRDRGRELVWPDQDALNLAARNRWLALHPRWNCMNSLYDRPDLAARTFGPRAVEAAKATCAIRHFEGPGTSKPWHAGHDRAEQHRYELHRQETPWPVYRPAGAAVENGVRGLASEACRRTRAFGRGARPRT